MMSSKKRVYKTYSEAFKRQVVQEYEAGASLSALQRKYGIGNLRTLRRWVEQYSRQGLRHGVAHIQTREEADRTRVLEAQVARLEKALAQMTLEKLLLESTLALYQETYGDELAEKKGPSSGGPISGRRGG